MNAGAPRRIVVASGNPGKLAEFARLFAGSGIACVPQGELGVDDVEETGATFIENALLKARHAAQATGLPALADDSGLCVDALDGAPGLYSARYAGTPPDPAANIARLLRELEGVPDARRGAHFHCTLALLRHPADPRPLVVQGEWHGRVLHAPRGAGGFGYDPAFVPDEHPDRTMAELDPAEKDAISHRGRAVRELRAWLRR